jgi:hypothetical protein
MGFTVNRPNGATGDAEFEVYARLLRLQGVDLGKLPRAPEPSTGRRWLYVWKTRGEAQAFADKLCQRTRDHNWAVVPVTTPPSEGPLGPILVQVARRSTGLVLELHPLSRALIQSAYPEAKPIPNTISINFGTLPEFQATHGSLENLASEILPVLTGLQSEALDRLGYALIEEGTGRTLLYTQPSDLVQG